MSEARVTIPEDGIWDLAMVMMQRNHDLDLQDALESASLQVDGFLDSSDTSPVPGGVESRGGNAFGLHQHEMPLVAHLAATLMQGEDGLSYRAAMGEAMVRVFALRMSAMEGYSLESESIEGGEYTVRVDGDGFYIVVKNW